MLRDLPLLGLFNCLREAGLPLGLDEYQLLLRALQSGFGRQDRDALERLCRILWTKSADDAKLFAHYFAKEIPPPIPDGENEGPANGRGQTTPPPRTPTIDTQPLTQTVETSGTENSASTAASVSDLTREIAEPVQAFKVALQAGDRQAEVADRIFLLSTEYFPVTRRRMKQSWRHLRRMIREGAQEVLDVPATVDQIGRQGVLIKPVLAPRRVNRAELLLLIDQGGSMTPFHALAERLAETALRGGRLGRAGIYYFHNCPVAHLYRNPFLLEDETVPDVLRRLHRGRTSVLVFSDGGAARGNLNEERLALTEQFLAQVRAHVPYVTWLNPMPSARWSATTAGEIARLVPMFETSRRGLDDAVSVLRGRRAAHFERTAR